jgi:hypothetical protein
MAAVKTATPIDFIDQQPPPFGTNAVGAEPPELPVEPL